MSRKLRKLFIVLPLAVGITVLVWGIFVPARHLSAQEQAASPNANSYLELSVEPPTVTVGTLVTLTIAYHNIGEVYTTINITPTGVVAFDPPLTMPCKYNQHPNGCTAITLRALSGGTVQFTAQATGEVYDVRCGCWIWSGAFDNGPASLAVVEADWRAFLPLIQR